MFNFYSSIDTFIAFILLIHRFVLTCAYMLKYHFILRRISNKLINVYYICSTRTFSLQINILRPRENTNLRNISIKCESSLKFK